MAPLCSIIVDVQLTRGRQGGVILYHHGPAHYGVLFEIMYAVQVNNCLDGLQGGAHPAASYVRALKAFLGYQPLASVKL